MMYVVREGFASFAQKASEVTGSVWAFGIAVLSVIVWAVTGPVFDYSDAWQLAINTGTTVVTFLVVFIIQHAQNREMRAVQLKLNEILAATLGASNRLIDVEEISEEELEHLHERYRHLAATAKRLQPGAKTSIDLEKASWIEERAARHAKR
jgi:low affinity Fe/Cu permease